MAVSNTAEAQDIPQFSGLDHIELEAIPDGHPVAVFAKEYANWVDGHLLPKCDQILDTEVADRLQDWMKVVEPVEHKGLVDFYLHFQGSKIITKPNEMVRSGWLSDLLDEDFIESRYHEAITASILRVPMFSRGAAPSSARAYMRHYRGVFPMFAENRPRLRLVILEAETYASVPGV